MTDTLINQVLALATLLWAVAALNNPSWIIAGPLLVAAAVATLWVPRRWTA